jgi:hypothetical protein
MASQFPLSSVDAATHWRLQPGYLRNHPLSLESVRLLLGNFFTDRTASNPLPEVSLFAETGRFEWGQAPPLEKVLNTHQDWELLLQHPDLYQNALVIIEPWEHVGINDAGEPVRASKNVAFVAQKIADCDSILWPLWSSGLPDLERIMPILTGSLGVVCEGGQPSVYAPQEWTHSACPRDAALTVVERLLVTRSSRSAPVLFICLSHQLAAAAHIRLLQKTVDTVLKTDALYFDADGHALATLKTVCQAIQAMGASLAIHKRDGRTVAQGWQDAQFAVSRNEVSEVGERVLLPYQPPRHAASGMPLELIHAHERMAAEHIWRMVMSSIMQDNSHFKISMFHNDEVNEEAILFANWAYLKLHEAVLPYRYGIAGSQLSGLLRLPYGVQILASTAANGHTVTECSCTSIVYKDFETGKIHHSYTCQFHPELLEDLRAIDPRPAPAYRDLKRSDGIRMLLRFMYYGML